MTSSPTFQHTVVFVANSDSRTIDVLELDRDAGSLTAVESVPFIGPDTPAYVAESSGPGPANPLAVSPDRRFLYAAARWQPYTVASFAIDAGGGRLTHLGNAPLPHSMAFISTDNSGRVLLGASYPGNLVSLSRIGEDGRVAGPAHQVVETTPNPHSLRTDASNHYVLVPSLGGDRVLQYRFDAASAILEPNTPPSVAVKPGEGPRHFVFHPNGRFAYVLTELASTLYAFAFDTTKGTLGELQSLPSLPPGFQGKPSAADLHITPDGRFIYASERVSSTLNAFAVDGDSGRLRSIGSFESEKQPRGFNIDSTGRYLIAVGQLSDSLTLYAIEPDSGRLSALSSRKVGRNPNWVEIIDLP